MITAEELRNCAKEFNKVLGIDPEIKTEQSITNLMTIIKYIVNNKDSNGQDFIQEGDEFTPETSLLIEKIKNGAGIESLPDDIPTISEEDSLTQQIHNAGRIRELKDICNANDEFKGLRGKLSAYSNIEDLRDKMIEMVTMQILDESKPEEKPKETTDGLKINNRFKQACPDLSSQEYKDLEALIIKDGKVLQPILTWDGFIVDGHNRHKIATEKNIPFTTEELTFKSEDDVIIWIKENAISQRNLPDFAKYELLKDIESLLKEEGKKKKVKGRMEFYKEASKERHNTRKILAKKSGISEAQLAQAKVIDKRASKKTKDKLRKGETTIGAEYKKIKDTKPVSDKERLDSAANELDKWVLKYSDDDLFDDFTQQVTAIAENIREKLPF